MTDPHPSTAPAFNRSSFCGDTSCVEVAVDPDGGRLVRDSKNPTGPALTFTADEWAAFVAGAKAGEFDTDRRAGAGPLAESLQRCVEALEDLIRYCDDPGPEALGAVYEAKQLVRRLDSGAGVGPLTFEALARTNRARAGRWHPGFPDGAWSGADWANAVAGEVGELAEVLDALVALRLGAAITAAAGQASNAVKKLRRIDDGCPGALDPDEATLLSRLGEEMADVVLYVDLLAQHYRIDLAAAVAAKFNAVSDRQGFPERLPGTACPGDNLTPATARARLDALERAAGTPEGPVAVKASGPVRVQLSRRKGARLPAGAVCVARPTKWGNPWRVGDPDPEDETFPPITPERAVAIYTMWLWHGPPEETAEVLDHLDELRGRDLACWCPLDGPCHADALLAEANAPVAGGDR